MDNKTKEHFAFTLNMLAKELHLANKKWWTDLATGKPKKRNVGEMLMLCVSELGEALEGDRKDLMDDHLPERKMIEVELADCVIRILDMAEGLGLNIGEALVEKHEYNQHRADHKLENRLSAGGKKY